MADDVKDPFLPESVDDLKGRTAEELRHMLEVVDAHARDLHQTEEGELRDLDPAEQKAFDICLQMRNEIIDRIDNHNKVMEALRRRPASLKQVYTNLTGLTDDPVGDTRRLSVPEARDQALKRLDMRDSNYYLDADQKDHVARQIRRDTMIARRILVTENDAYRTAWMKMVTDPHPMLEPEEQRAIMAWNEFRAVPGMQDFVSASGGFGIPVKLAA